MADSHAAAHAPAHAAHGHGHTEHAHPTAKTYFQIAVILFLLTFFEVAGYEVTHPDAGQQLSGFGAMLQPIFVEVLLLLSAAKFALVAMYYMHLKSDGKLLSSIFSFSLVVATIVVVGLMVLFYYHYSY